MSRAEHRRCGGCGGQRREGMIERDTREETTYSWAWVCKVCHTSQRA